MTVKDTEPPQGAAGCPTCGGTHFGSYECPFISTPCVDAASEPDMAVAQQTTPDPHYFDMNDIVTEGMARAEAEGRCWACGFDLGHHAPGCPEACPVAPT